MRWHANDDSGRVPLLDQSCNCFMIDAVVTIGDNAKWTGRSRYVLTNRNPNAA
jgi:hypothetical protein